MILKLARVLVIDDSMAWREQLGGFLHDYGFAVDTAADLSGAIRLLENQQYDVILLDIRLSDYDENDTSGLKLLQHIAKIDLAPQVIVMTGYATAALVRQALRPSSTDSQPAFDFIEKANLLGDKDLLGTIRNAINDDRTRLRNLILQTVQLAKEGKAAQALEESNQIALEFSRLARISITERYEVNEMCLTAHILEGRIEHNVRN